MWTSTTPEDRKLEYSVPKEFGGPGSGFSPEDIYISALANCYVATFKVIAANSKVDFTSLDTTGELTLDVNAETKKPWMSQAKLNVLVKTTGDIEKVERFANRVTSQCLILNSVKTEVIVSVRVETSGAN